ncbi:MAG: cardiolipin synthase, partial [Deltaproteobacteria bacterium]|nr:cardiolipin synthase [Deltaproteobacteria bacterium]
PYFVPDEPIFHALNTAALRGADVKVLVPAAGDVPLVAAAARTYYPELLNNGVRIFEYGPPVLHSKTLVVDDDLAIIGTANTDNRSFRLNFEVVVANYDAEICDGLATAFDVDLECATEVTLAMLQEAPFMRRLVASAARLFSPVL